MAKKKYEESEGVWRTIGGRRVFIRTGQSLSDAMKQSGKFKTKMNEKAVKGAREEDLKEQYKDSLNNVSKMEYNGEITTDEYNEAIKNINNAYKERKLGKNIEGQSIEKEKYNAYKNLGIDPEDDFGGIGDEVYARDFKNFADKYFDGDRGKAQEYISHENNKEAFGNYEYNLYQRAKLFPNSIDPMTENSTDWEALDKKYGARFKSDKAKADLKNAEVMLKGSQRSLEFEKDGLARAKRDGQSVENISDRTRRVHDLELEVQKNKNYYNKMIKDTSYIKTLEKHNLNDNDPEFKRAMLGRMESDINYYLGNGGGYEGHLWGKEENEHINIMKALYNTLPEKEKPDWINEKKIEEYSKQMDFVKNNKSIKQRYSTMYDYLKNNTLMSEIEIIKYLKELEKNKK